MNLNDRALLVQLSVSQWTARKYDKKATQDVANTYGTSTQAGRYNKALLPANDLLDHVHKKTTHIRTKFYELSENFLQAIVPQYPTQMLLYLKILI